MRVGIPLMVNVPPKTQITVRFTIKNPLCALKLQVLPEGGVRVKIYSYRDDIVIEYVDADSGVFVESREIDPVLGPELWLDLGNESDAQRCIIATFVLEKGE